MPLTTAGGSYTIGPPLIVTLIPFELHTLCLQDTGSNVGGKAYIYQFATTYI